MPSFEKGHTPTQTHTSSLKALFLGSFWQPHPLMSSNNLFKETVQFRIFSEIVLVFTCATHVHVYTWMLWSTAFPDKRFSGEDNWTRTATNIFSYKLLTFSFTYTVISTQTCFQCCNIIWPFSLSFWNKKCDNNCNNCLKANLSR